MQPHEFPRRVLVCVTGMTPQVLTETLYSLAVRRKPAFVPTEVHAISTAEGIERARLMLLSKDKSQFANLMRDYSLPEISLSAGSLHVIRDPENRPLSDIRTPEDNASAADAITALLADLTADADAAIHVSIAGGRKTMGYYLGYALSLFGRPQDRLSHVLVSPEFESLPEFFYPSPRETILMDRSGKPLDASTARVDLAEIPFVRLRDDLPAEMLVATRFADVVAAASRVREPPKLRVLLSERAIECSGARVELSPQAFAFYAWLAERCWDETEVGGLVKPTEFNDPESTLRMGLVELGDRLFQNEFASGYDQWLQWDPQDFGDKNNEWVYQRYHDINRRLQDALGKHAAAVFQVQSVPVGGKRRGYSLALTPEQIEIVQ